MVETRWRSVCQGAIALLSSKSSAAETCYEGRVGWVRQGEWWNEGIEWVQEKWNPLKSSLISSALLRGVPSVWVCVSILDYFDCCSCVCVWLEKWLREARDNERVYDRKRERETITPQDIPFFILTFSSLTHLNSASLLRYHIFLSFGLITISGNDRRKEESAITHLTIHTSLCIFI